MMQLSLQRCFLPLVLAGAVITASGARTASTGESPTTSLLTTKSKPKEAPSTAFRDATSAAIASLGHEAPRVTTPAPAQMVLAAELELRKKDVALNQTLFLLNRTETEGGALVETVATLQQTDKQSKAEEVSLEDDKTALLKTVQDVMRTNQTRVEEEQVQDLTRLEKSVQERCAREQEDLEARLQHAEARAKEAEAARDDAKEVAQALKEQHTELQNAEASLRSEIEELRKKTKGAEVEKSVALETLRGLLKKNVQFKEGRDEPSAKVRFEHTVDATPDVNLRLMGETTAMDAYMAKVQGSQTSMHVLPRPTIDSGVNRFRRQVRVAKARRPKKTRLSKWLDGEAEVVPMKSEVPAPAVSSPLDALSGLMAPDDSEGADDAAESSSADALLRRAEDALSS